MKNTLEREKLRRVFRRINDGLSNRSRDIRVTTMGIYEYHHMMMLSNRNALPNSQLQLMLSRGFDFDD